MAVHYRARPETDPGSHFARSFIGLAFFTPRSETALPLSGTGAVPFRRTRKDVDTLGVEDPRITRLGDVFYMVYCGVAHDPRNICERALCMARSPDLLHWEKLGPIPGDINQHNNKDGVLFPEPVDGQVLPAAPSVWQRHCPSENGIRLAASRALEGPYSDCGEVLHAYPNPRMQRLLGGGRVGADPDGRRALRAASTTPATCSTRTTANTTWTRRSLISTGWIPAQPASAVTGRIEHLMTPETPAELRSHSALQVGNVLFACGSYEYRGRVYIIYGGADTYTLAARVNRQSLFTALEQAGLENPFVWASRSRTWIAFEETARQGGWRIYRI